MTMTRESWTNLSLADSYDLWPFDDHRGDGGGWLVIVFRDSFSSVISNELGPMVWKTEHAAQVKSSWAQWTTTYNDIHVNLVPDRTRAPGPHGCRRSLLCLPNTFVSVAPFEWSLTC